MADVVANMMKWDRRFLELAKHVAQWSKDPSTKVGAVLVNPMRHVVAMGYNGLPTYVNDTPERLNNREVKYKMIVHAEQNAIIQAGSRAEGCTLYVWPSFGCPNICSDCAKLAIQAEIIRIVGYQTDSPRANWADSLKLAGEMLHEAFVDFYQIPEEPNE